jgi:hypothetical protein
LKALAIAQSLTSHCSPHGPLPFPAIDGREPNTLRTR